MRRRVRDAAIVAAAMIIMCIYTIGRISSTVVCIGDSITFGAGVYDTRYSESYPAYLQQLLGENYRVVNLGRSGTTAQRANPCAYTRSQQYRRSHMIGADIYIIMLGTNDTKPFNWDARAYEADLRALVEEYVNRVGAENIYLMQPPKCFLNESKGEILYGIDDNIVRDEMRPIVSKMAEDMGVHYIDMYEFTENHPEYYDDGIHPNAYGNKMIAEYLYETIWK